MQVVRGKFRAFYIREQERSQVKKLNFYLKKLEKEEQNNPTGSKRK